MPSDAESLPPEKEFPPPLYGLNGKEEDHQSPNNSSLLASICFRTVRPTDIPACYELEKAGYPEDEAASKSKLQYRQHHAARYFRCAVLGDEEDNEQLVGFVCATRCRAFRAESMTTHAPDGELLAIHSVVVKEEYRRQGVATAMMKDYVSSVDASISKIVLMAKKAMLSFYVDCGFAVTRPSPISHGKDAWYELEMDLSGRREGLEGTPCYIVEAFTGDKWAGNPAAVVVLEEARESSWMQRVAQEFNLSETAFLVPKDTSAEDELHYSIRYFTPTTEVPLCGHATLASAAILFDTVYLKNRVETTISFTTVEGIELGATMAVSSIPPAPASMAPSPAKRRSHRITMRFPSKPAVALEDRTWVEEMLKSALKVLPEAILFAGLSEIGDVLVELTTDSFLSIPHEGMNFDAMLYCDGYSRGVIICCVDKRPKEEDGSDDDDDSHSAPKLSPDFLSRFFGPKAGINEDPVTGSAHCVLAPYFCSKLKRDKVVGMQTSLRCGVVECVVEGDTVQLTGTAVTTMTGTLWL